MTVSEMHTAFRLYLDKSTSLVASVDFLPEEIDFWLNESQDRFIKQRMFGNNYRQLGFEQSEKRIDDLRNLLVVSSKYSLSQSSIAPNIKSYLLPVSDSVNPYLYYINSAVYNSSNARLQTGGVMQEEHINEYIKDFINNPYIRRPLVVIINNTINFVHGDEFIPSQFDMTYIRKPRKLVLSSPGTYQTTTCELAEHTHREIVTMAASLVLENIESPRVQTFEPLNASKIE